MRTVNAVMTLIVLVVVLVTVRGGCDACWYFDLSVVDYGDRSWFVAVIVLMTVVLVTVLMVLLGAAMVIRVFFSIAAFIS